MCLQFYSFAWINEGGLLEAGQIIPNISHRNEKIKMLVKLS
jgi:hypothetical protein